ncbi:aldo/keto reductase [uncultured Methanomethylovorans sp.]|uniref:aldo/keto reductase n=1 Tax=uncultured Methanomethylovorans sp. TaxID=183759 RepID=UPI002AA8A8C9|nr:aldo/keto reductase [uncultured Methanomethylovorans sp.]
MIDTPITINNKIALGTVQFGLDYGINNKNGQIPETKVFEILQEAIISGISILDTAYVYGNSEQVIGNFIKKCGNQFKIISKLPECNPEEVITIFDSSLQRLNVNRLYGYMCHSFQHCMQNPEIWETLNELRSEGRVEKIGLSLYYPSELENIISSNLKFDIVQVPYNVFDRRFEPFFSILKQRGVEIFVRSTFLQGLVFKKPSELDGYFSKIQSKIATLHSLAAKMNVPIAALCLNFVVLNEFVDRVVVGVDSTQNLQEIISSSVYCSNVKNVLHELDSLCEDDENMILPTNWKVQR